MEEGSLLQVALEHAKALRTASAHDSLQRNCLLLDLYSLGTQGGTHQEENEEEGLLGLARLAEICNQFFQSKGHCWHYGADGPVFGIHLDKPPSGSESKSETRIPHLRAYCRYGPSVQDAWMAVRYLVEFLKTFHSGGDNNKDSNCHVTVAARIWDVQDGQLLLIQLADLLPAWVDEDSTDHHCYACWIDSDGHLQLLRQPHISLHDALRELRRLRQRQSSSSWHPKLQEALDYWLDLNAEAASLRQRTPMVLPRTVALAFEERPDLLWTSLQAFCEHVQSEHGPMLPGAAVPTLDIDFTKHEDWVWTVESLSRTNYAMARTVCSTRGDWTSSPDSMPMGVGVEVKRYRRQCQSDASKHLQHAVALGVRAVGGLELLLRSSSGTKGKNDHNSKEGIFATATPLSSLQERILHWDRVQQTYSHATNRANSRTILASFQRGPNQARLDLTHVLKCPVFPEEAHNWTSYSNPQSSLKDQVKSLLRSSKHKKDSEDNTDDERFWVPRADQVDGEDWMECGNAPGGGSSSVTAIDSQQGLDDLLSRFQSFLNRTSGVEGISSSKDERTNSRGEGTKAKERIEIRPRVFLNILHSVLQGDKLEFPKVDPYFYREDYDLAQEGDSDSNSDGDDEGAIKENEGLFRMNDLMNAMDQELEARTESRRIPSTATTTKSNHDRDGVQESVAADAHILNNLLESLDASGGGSGPVVNILKEMEGSG